MNRERLMGWLKGPDVIQPDGSVMSWVNPAHPGFVYPEAGAVVLRLLALESHPPTPLVEKLVARLRTQRPGKFGHVYTFDRGLVLAALATAGHADNDEGDRIAAAIKAGVAVDPKAPPRWSSVLGPHLLKLAVAGRLVRGHGLLRALDRLRPTLADGGRIPTPPHRETYVHAHCYAVEGLLALGDVDNARRAATWLAEIQHESGGMPSWHDGRRGRAPHPTDATAQAIRLWCCIDRSQFSLPIDRGLAFLERLAPSGVRYSDVSQDLNTWSTAFAIQALDFAQGRPYPLRIV